MDMKATEFAEAAIALFLAGKGTPVVDCLIGIGFAESRSAAKRAIEQGSIKIGNTRIQSTQARMFSFTDMMFCVDPWDDGTFNIITK